jgi:benzodiazapine receptor
MPLNIIKLLICIFICEFAGIIGSIFNIKSIPKWYSKIKKPSFNPPSWIFGPVWTILYLLMGISLYLVWNSGKITTLVIIIFSIQLILNMVWSFLFFGIKKPGYAFAEIILLWISIISMMFVFYQISNIAGLIQIPYLMWVTFASVLNFSLWKLNKR